MIFNDHAAATRATHGKRESLEYPRLHGGDRFTYTELTVHCAGTIIAHIVSGQFNFASARAKKHDCTDSVAQFCARSRECVLHINHARI